MRLLVQRVTAASVTTAERGIIGSINKGLCVLVGITSGDGAKEVEWATNHLLNIKFWPDVANPASNWKTSVMTGGFQVLLISQFTLFAEPRKKGKLDFHKAAPAAEAGVLYDQLMANMVSSLGSERCAGGEFGAYMQVHIENDGPVTIILDSNDE